MKHYSRTLPDLITAEELKRAHNTIRRGMKVTIIDHHWKREDGKFHVIEDEVDTWFSNVIILKSGHTTTFKEFAIWLRQPNKPLGHHFINLSDLKGARV